MNFFQPKGDGLHGVGDKFLKSSCTLNYNAANPTSNNIILYCKMFNNNLHHTERSPLILKSVNIKKISVTLLRVSCWGSTNTFN